MVDHSGGSRSAVTSAAIGLRSERCSVTWPNSGWPGSASITDVMPSWRPTRRLSRWRDVVGEHHPAALAEAGQRGEQHGPLEVLRLVDDHERVGEAAAPDVGERQHLEQVAGQHLLDDLRAGDGVERVEHRRAPGRHLLVAVAGQEAEVLAADGEQRAEDDDPLVRALLEHGLEPGGQRQHALAGAGPAAEAHDADLGIGEQVEGDPLLGAAARARRTASGRRARGAPACRVHPAERRLRAAGQRDPGVARQVAGLVEVDDPLVEQLVDDRLLDRELDEAGPVLVVGLLVAVLVGVEADDAGLEPQRQVLGDDGDAAPSAARLWATARMRWSLSSDGSAGRQRRACPGG